MLGEFRDEELQRSRLTGRACFRGRFGLGRVYQKTGKLQLAEYHFRRALAINPSNVVLYCCVGTVSDHSAMTLPVR